MIREELVFVATCDISGLARGKGFPARELPARLKKGVGWTGSNLTPPKRAERKRGVA